MNFEGVLLFYFKRIGSNLNMNLRTIKPQPMKNTIRRESDKKRLALLMNFSLAFAMMIGLVMFMHHYFN